MAASKPVLFLAFANDDAAPLAQLKEERRGIRSQLLEAQSAGSLEVYTEPEATVKMLAEALQQYDERIALFHYGGHADAAHLMLEDQQAHAGGIAAMLAELKGLQLVFLNGCSTRGQVVRLMELGVKLVIATDKPVNDRMAVDFATAFYGALAKRRPISRAFRLASAQLQATYGETAKPQEVSYRGLKWNKVAKASDDPEPIPWGLYVNDGAEEALTWRMPSVESPLDPRMSAILSALSRYEEDIHEDVVDRDGEAVDERLYPEIIIKNFPWPIGAQLRILQTEELFEPGVARLKQVLSTYLMAMHLHRYLLYSQLWEEKLKHPDLPTKDCLPWLLPEKEAFFQQDMPGKLLGLADIFDQHQLTPFVSEMEGFFAELRAKGEIFEACMYLHDLAVKGKWEEEEAIEVCEEAETKLAYLQVGMAYLARYHMHTIKDIDILNPRHAPPRFKHEIGELNTYTIRRDSTQIREEFSDSQSVMLTDPERNTSMSLSPFIVDKNAFIKKPIPNIFLYTHAEDGVPYYVNVKHSLYKTMEEPSDQIHVEMEGLEVLEDQWEVYRRKMSE